MITLINRQRKIPLDELWLTALVQEILIVLKYEDFDVGILCTTNKTIGRYNELYRHKKGPTDILSFAYYPHHTPGSKLNPLHADEKNLGDLILSPEYIIRSAKKLNIPFEQQLMILIIHGICHLLGYDHEDDEQYEIMKALEDSIRVQLPMQLQR
jgi:probable rRNA maturation factor